MIVLESLSLAISSVALVSVSESEYWLWFGFLEATTCRVPFFVKIYEAPPRSKRWRPDGRLTTPMAFRSLEKGII